MGWHRVFLYSTLYNQLNTEYCDVHCKIQAIRDPMYTLMQPTHCISHCTLYQSCKKRVLWVLQNRTFFRFSNKSVLFSANILPNLIKSYQILPNVTKAYQLYQSVCTFYQILHNFTKTLQNQVKYVIYAALSQFQICLIDVFFCQICIPKKSWLAKKLLIATLHFTEQLNCVEYCTFVMCDESQCVSCSNAPDWRRIYAVGMVGTGILRLSNTHRILYKVTYIFTTYIVHQFLHC